MLWEGAEECYRVAEPGQPVGYFFGYKSKGIFQNQAQIDNYKGALLNGKKTQPGDVIWEDNDHNGVIDTNDRTKLGDPHPDFTMGLSFNISWKALDLSVTTYGAFGQQIMKCYRDFSSSPLQNYTTDILKRWHVVENSDNSQGGSFSAISANAAYRKQFAEDCLAFIKKWGIDGIDMDWEFPGLSWSGAAWGALVPMDISLSTNRALRSIRVPVRKR